MSIVNKEIGPVDISIGISLPTDLDSFKRYFSKPAERGDYVRALRRKNGDTAESLYKREYETKANRLQQFIHYVRDAGVEVFCDATLDTVSEASMRRDILVFAGHWKGYGLTYWDFLQPPAVIFDRLKTVPDVLIRGLIDVIEAREPDLRDELNRGAESAVPRLRAALNHGIECFAKSEAVAPGTLDMLIQQEPAALRERIDMVLGPAIVVGNRFEMSNGFVDAYEFARALQNDREGIVDLVVCKSNYPASAIRRERKFIQPITAENDKHPLGWPWLIEATVRLLRHQRMPYWTARQDARELLSEIAKEEKQ